jgi:hypothetical protein
MEVLQRTANRGSISTASAYEIDNSLKLNSANSEYLYITRDASGSDWNRLLWTASMWVKHIPTESSATSPKERMFGASDANSDFDIRFRGQPIGFRNNSDVDGVAELRTTAVYRDYSSWYHVVAVWDTANGTAGNRMRLYVNGEEVTSFSTDTQPSQNEKSIWGKKNDGTDGDVAHTIGAYYNASSGFAQGFNGYMAEVHWVEGAALAPTEFGEFDDDSGIWKPKEADVTYGTNGFYLKFDDSSALGADSSGNSNNWSLNNIAAADQATDTPTNNFCIMNVLKGGINLSGTVYNRLPLMTEGATVVGNNANSYTFLEATMGVTSGKWYWEMKPTVDANTLVSGAGIATNTNLGFSSTDGVGNFFYHYAGTRYVNGASTGYGAAWTTNDIIGFAYDADNWTLTCYINNSSQGNLLASQADLSAEIAVPYMYSYGTHTYQWNFGGYHANSLSSAASDANGYGSFEYAPPSGYYALCTKNLAEYG